MTKTQYKRMLRRNKRLKEVRQSEKNTFKKIRRRIWWEVNYYNPEENGKLTEKDFCSAIRARKFVAKLLKIYKQEYLSLEVQKVWCYREYSPRHMTRYYDFRPPNKFIRSHGDSF